NQNGRIVLELDPNQVEVIGTPLKWESEEPISREEQAMNMGNWLAKLSADLGVPALVFGQSPKPGEREKVKPSEHGAAHSNNHEREGERPEASNPQTISGNERSEEMAENQSERNGPLYSLRSTGRVQGSIWDREGPSGETRYTVSVFRSYKD